MNKLLLILLISVTAAGFATADVESEGKAILEKTDRVLYPLEGTLKLHMKARDSDGKVLEYEYESYKKNHTSQTLVGASPAVLRNWVGMRSGDTIYEKMAKAPKANIMSYQAVFAGSALSLGDVLSSDLASDYRVTGLSQAQENGKNVFLLVLAPRKTGMYARVEMTVDVETAVIYRRHVFTPQGELLKKFEYTDYILKNGAAQSFTVFCEDFFMDNSCEAFLSEIKQEKLPAFLFDPANIGRIHAK